MRGVVKVLHDGDGSAYETLLVDFFQEWKMDREFRTPCGVCPEPGLVNMAFSP